MTHTPQTLFEKLRDAHIRSGAKGVSVEVSLNAKGRKPKGFDKGYAIPGSSVLVPAELPLTQGAFGALAFRNASNLTKAQSVRVSIEGPLPKAVDGTDFSLVILRELTPHLTEDPCVVEVAGPTIDKLDIDARMTLCAQLSNLSAVKAVIMQPSKTVLKALNATQEQLAKWRPIHSDEDAEFSVDITIQAQDIKPQATWTENPRHSAAIDSQLDSKLAEEIGRFNKGKPIRTLPIDLAFIGPFEDIEEEALQSALEVFKGRKVANGVTVFIIPGSKALKKLAESKGWDKSFIHSGCVWDPTAAVLKAHKREECMRCAETLPLVQIKPRHNTCHFMSAQMVATASICGRIADVREFV